VVLTATLRLAEVVPLVGVTVSQLPPLLVLAAAVNESAEPELAIASV
jgi:hypothetical protein